jgi:hypothetical protein
MLAPVNGPKTIADIATHPPIATAASSPTARESVATEEITNIKIKVIENSIRHKLLTLTVSTGCVSPKVVVGSLTILDNKNAPAMHPSDWARI